MRTLRIDSFNFLTYHTAVLTIVIMYITALVLLYLITYPQGFAHGSNF